MNERDIERVQLINRYCQEIIASTSNMDYDEFTKNLMLNRGIVLTIEQIGENAHKLSPDFKQSYDTIPWQAMSSMRNRIAHGYSSVNLDIIWLTITTDIPKLLEFTKHILENEVF